MPMPHPNIEMFNSGAMKIFEVVAIGRLIMPLDVAPRHFSRKLNLRSPTLGCALILRNLRCVSIRPVARPRRCRANCRQLVIELGPLSVSPNSESVRVVEHFVVSEGIHSVLNHTI